MAFMKIAILGDIHSNIDALEAVLQDAQQQKVEKYCCVGDVVGYNACPRECLDRVRGLNAVIVRGNHDHYCSYNESLSDFHPLAAEVVDWTRNVLTAEERRFLHDLPLVQMVESFTVVHSTLDNPDMWGYVFDKLEAESNFAYQATSVCFYGHTHVPLVFEKSETVRSELFEHIRISLGKKYFINVGSIGQPRDGDPRAAYAVFNTLRNTIELRRISYDIEAAQKRNMDAGLPERLAARLAVGK
jgi:diadenosine tetraphosphatase ApaH/serine/threonine PP2A family protein phosphatase